MALEQFKAPALPAATPQYDQQYQNQLLKVLRIYFNQLDSMTPNQAYSYRADHFYGGDLTTDYVDFKTDNTATDVEGRLRWNSADETLNLGMAHGVIQQIGEEWYARVRNITGSTIPNGTVVGFAPGSAGNALGVAPYIANGTQPTLYVLGIMTHDLPDGGDMGYCTVWGSIHDLNTTGAPVGETWVAGDVLYASPTTAGALTKVKPTAPNNVIPMAAVTEVSATTGTIFVRPTIEQQRWYGTFSDTTTQTPAAIYTPYAVTFNTTDLANGFSRGTPTSRIVAANSGYYNFQFSAELTSGSASAKKIWIWPRVNGVDVPNSNSEITVSGSNTVLIPSWNWAISMDANDYFELMFAVEDTNIQLLHVAAQTGAAGTATFARPAVPSIILTVTQVQL